MGSVLFTKISRLYTLFSRGDFNHVLKFSQTDVFASSSGRACIAGLGEVRAPAADAYQTFPSVAPQLVDPRRCEFHDAGPTISSDVYTFAVLAWETRIQQVPSVNRSLSKTVCG